MDGRVRLEVGPVPGVIAREWIDNSRAIVSAVRVRRFEVSIDVRPPILDLIDAVLDIWHDAAQGVDTFQWGADVEVDNAVALAEEWRRLAALTPEDLVVLGCQWADERTLPMFDALVTAFATALKSVPATAELGVELEVRPPGRE